jgi:hypothetical protein
MEPDLKAPLPHLNGSPIPSGIYYPTQTRNTSGMREDVPLLIAGGWNWGAFVFTGLWLLNHGVHGFGWGLLITSLIAYGICPILNLYEVPFTLGLLSLGMSIALGINGNRIAWHNRAFESIENFRSCQRIWSCWAIVGGVLITAALIPILFIFFCFASFKT